MSEYAKQTKDFLESCNANMTITRIGLEANKNWNEKVLRATYRVTITTPLGRMWVKFWDSVHNTKKNIAPNEYDILDCLQKYDVGSFDDFVDEFGYETEEPKDLSRAKRIYKGVVKEYEGICRCFTEKQIEQMREIW